MKPVIALVALLAMAGNLVAGKVTCKVKADTWVEIPEFDKLRAAEARKAGHGSDTRLVISGRESFALLDFDLAAVKGTTVRRAVLRLHREPAAIPLLTVGLSTVSGAGAWTESAAGFLFGRADGAFWSYLNSDITDVTFGLGGSLYAYLTPRDAGGGWWELDVPPALVTALATGDQFGLMLDDEKGQTHTNHIFSSREGANPPELIVETEGGGQTAPGLLRSLRKGAPIESTPAEARAIGMTTLRPGSAIVKFAGAAARYELRYSASPVAFDQATPVQRWQMDPLAPKPNAFATANTLGGQVTAVVEGLTPGRTYHFLARATNGAGKVGPVSELGVYRAYSRSFPVLPKAAASKAENATGAAPPVWAIPELWKIDPRTGAVLEASGATDHRLSNPVWNAGSATVKLEGARNEFVAFQLAVEGATLEGVEVKVSKPLFAESKLPAIFAGQGAVQLYREWFVPDGRNRAGWYPDPLIPLKGAIDVPARDNGVPGQRVQPLFVDIYIPHDARPGRHTGELAVTGGGLNRKVAIQVDVLPLTLPDKLNFLVDLNCYSSVNAGWNLPRGTPEYRALEIAYHRLAHLNRANLDVLGYNHDGSTSPDHTPELTGAGAATKTSDWSGWDALFGPIVSGEAFRDLPRAGVPVPVVYLPFFEFWPGDYRRGYKWDDATVPGTEKEYQQLITAHALRAGAVEDGLSQEYQDRAITVGEQFSAHLVERGWIHTRYMLFFNDKYYFKRPSQGGRGISWWLMDEPNHRDDSRAMSIFANLFMTGLKKHPEAPVRFRADISRVEWTRDLLTRQLDVTCTSSHLFEKSRYMLDNRQRFGREYWHYSSTNHPRESNVSMRAWAWKAWLGGADGIVPWNTVRGAQAWDRAEPLTVFYVGTKFGSKEPFGCLRLKAFRRGQQDVEYLVMLAARAGWDREAVTRAVAGELDLSGGLKQTYDEDAGTMDYRSMKDGQLEALRERVARAIATGAPRHASTSQAGTAARSGTAGRK